MKSLDYGKNYQYAHDFEGNFVAQEFLPAQIAGTVFFEPGNNGAEGKVRERLRGLWREKYGY